MAARGAALLALALLAGAGRAAPQRNKAVHVSVTAPWGATPLALEASEFFGASAPGESERLFWEYARALPAVVGKSDKEQYEAAITTAAPLVSAGQLDLLKYALAIRQFSPKVHAHRTLWEAAEAAGCNAVDGTSAVAVVDGHECVSDPGEGLKKALKAASARNGTGGGGVHDLDHEYASASASSSPSVVVHLYAAMGSESFRAFHAVLAKRAAKGKIRYILRHAWPAGGEGAQAEMQVQGYGVEMAIKNMEYKAVDDQKKEGGASALGDGEEEDEVAGFDFKVLLQRKPEREVELISFRDALLSEVRKAESTDIKVWALKDLGVQASQRILQSEDPLRLIRDLSHNLPALVNSISRMRVNETIRTELEGNRQYMHPGTNMIYVNGRKLHLDALTPYNLFDFVKHEVKMMDSMQGLGLDTRSSRKILNAPSDDDGMGGMGGEEHAFKLDIKDDEHVLWLNDIEKDDMYKQWPRSLQALLQRGWPGQLRYVRRNLWTAIYMIDPSSMGDLEFISDALNMVHHQLPVRFGFVFKSSALPEEAPPPAAEGKTEDPEPTSSLDPGVAFHRLFRALYVRHGNKAAFEFGDGYYRKTVSGERDGPAAAQAQREAMKEIFKATAKRYRTDKGKAKYGRDLKNATMDDLLRRSSEFARNSGVGTTGPAAVVNGAVLEGEAMDEQNLHYLLQTQMVELQRMTYFGQVCTSVTCTSVTCTRQKRPTCVAKETYLCGKRDLLVCAQVSRAQVSCETCSQGKRDLLVWQKRPTCVAKETYLCGKRAKETCVCDKEDL